MRWRCVVVMGVARASQLARGLKHSDRRDRRLNNRRAGLTACAWIETARARGTSGKIAGRAGLTACAWIETLGDISGNTWMMVARASQLARGLKPVESRAIAPMLWVARASQLARGLKPVLRLQASDALVARASQLARGLKPLRVQASGMWSRSRGPHSLRVD